MDFKIYQNRAMVTNVSLKHFTVYDLISRGHKDKIEPMRGQYRWKGSTLCRQKLIRTVPLQVIKEMTHRIVRLP